MKHLAFALIATFSLTTIVYAGDITHENKQKNEKGHDHVAAHIASPEQYTLLFENDAVMVIKMILKPGEADIPHGHHNETVYFQQGGTLKITENGKAFEVKVPDGHIMYHEAWEHQVTNIGNTEVVAIIVEQKPAHEAKGN